MKLTDDDKTQIADTLTSYADGLEQVMRRYDLGVDEAEEIGLDLNIERCSVCDWYVPSDELLDSEGEATGICTDCRPSEDTDD